MSPPFMGLLQRPINNKIQTSDYSTDLPHARTHAHAHTHSVCQCVCLYLCIFVWVCVCVCKWVCVCVWIQRNCVAVNLVTGLTTDNGVCHLLSDPVSPWTLHAIWQCTYNADTPVAGCVCVCVCLNTLVRRTNRKGRLTELIGSLWLQGV